MKPSIRVILSVLVCLVLAPIVVAAPGHSVDQTSARIPSALKVQAYLPLLTANDLPSNPNRVRFAVIGDYGSAGADEQDVADLIASWSPDFIITVGDNNYPKGAAATIDANIGQYYHSFIAPYTGEYGAGATTNRFFSSLGNHDWESKQAAPYLNYFTLPGNERYYDLTWGPLHLFAIDSDDHEPDGDTADSIQGRWLQERLGASQSCWDIVYMHHSPFSSGQHQGSSRWMQWPYGAWGADAILSGHDHLYERLVLEGLPYFVNGLGGETKHPFGTPVAGSQARYNADFGAMLVDADKGAITFQFIARTGLLIDTYRIEKSCA